jgi:hypothetical protein
MNELKTLLKLHVQDLLETAKQQALKNDPDLLDAHKDFPHCEVYVVDLVDKIKSSFAEVHTTVSKSDIVNIFYRYSGNINANEARLNDIMKLS